MEVSSSKQSKRGSVKPSSDDEEMEETDVSEPQSTDVVVDTATATASSSSSSKKKKRKGKRGKKDIDADVDMEEV